MCGSELYTQVNEEEEKKQIQGKTGKKRKVKA